MEKIQHNIYPPEVELNEDGDVLSKPTTDKIYKKFCEYCNLYVDKLNLRQWDISYILKPLEEETQSCCAFDVKSYHSEISLNTSLLPYYMTDTGLHYLALHEVLHLFFAELELITLCEDFTKTQRMDLFDSKTHGLINVIASLVL